VKSLAKKVGHKLGWIFFAVIFLVFIEISLSFEKSIFLNRTPSMPRGLYAEMNKDRYDIGDIIIFKYNGRNSDLIKYIAAIYPNEFCIDEDAYLWIDGVPNAKINIEKYPEAIPNQSKCQRLEPDELLVLGEHPDSFDSRYFGPIKVDQVIAEVWPLWLFE